MQQRNKKTARKKQPTTTREASLRRLSARLAEPTYSDREHGTQNTHPDQFGFDRWSREREIICVVYAIPAETGLFRPPLALGSLHIRCDAKCFFHARTSSHHHQPACKMVNPSQYGSSKPLMGAIRQELRSHSMIMWTEVLSSQPKVKMPNSISG